MTETPKYKRVLIKLSGESMTLSDNMGVDSRAIEDVVSEIIPLTEMGVQVGLVVGGGNFIRGRQLLEDPHIQRTTADYMGMLATVMNSLALCDTFNSRGIPARVFSAVPMPKICPTFTQHEVEKQLRKNRVLIFAGGTGNPFCTTDTCASLRASEIQADLLVKATKVDGVFDSDPMLNPNAKKYDHLTYNQVLADRLGVMDLSAISMCMENDIPIVVLQVSKSGNLRDAICGKSVGTLVNNEAGEN